MNTTRKQPLARFAIEKLLLTALPDVPPVLAAWSTVTVHRGAHIQHHKALYSVPFALVGKTLWVPFNAAPDADGPFNAYSGGRDHDAGMSDHGTETGDHVAHCARIGLTISPISKNCPNKRRHLCLPPGFRIVSQ